MTEALVVDDDISFLGVDGAGTLTAHTVHAGNACTFLTSRTLMLAGWLQNQNK